MTQQTSDDKDSNQSGRTPDRKMASTPGENQRLLEELVGTAGNLIVPTDPDGRIILFNRVCQELTGNKREEVSGKTRIEQIIQPARNGNGRGRTRRA